MDRTLLHAATSGDVDALKRVAERGANLLDGKTPFGNTALHIAVTFKRQQFIEDICERRPALLGRRNVNGETPLHLAEILGSHEAVVFFLEHAGPPDVEPVAAPDVEPAVAPLTGVQALLRAVDRYGNNTLHVALLNGHVEVAKKLVSADPGLAAHINQNDESPLYLAAMRGFLEIVQLLLECVPCDHRGPRGQTAMHAAVSGGHQGIARAILETRAEIKKDERGQTPLHYAVYWGDLKMVQLLLEHDSSAAYVADGDGRLPVHVCAGRGHVAVFLELFRMCPDAVDAVDGKGRNALHIAIERQNKLVQHLVVTPGLDRLLNQRDNEGKTPLHVAVKEHNPSILRQLMRSKRVDMSVTDQHGHTAAQSFYTDKEPHLCPAWYGSHSILREVWAKDDASKLNFIRKNLHRMENELLMKMLDEYPRNLSLVAVLMATVTFAAAFTIPGGYVNDDDPKQGLAVLSRKAAVQVFLISDTISMCCSLWAAYLYSTIAIKQEAHQWLYAKFGRVLVSLAFLGMMIAFATGIYAVVAPDCLWLGILICFLCCSLAFIAVDVSTLSIFIAKAIINIERIVSKLHGNN